MTVTKSLSFEKMEKILSLWDTEAPKECRGWQLGQGIQEAWKAEPTLTAGRARLPEQERATNTGRTDPDQA